MLLCTFAISNGREICLILNLLDMIISYLWTSHFDQPFYLIDDAHPVPF